MYLISLIHIYPYDIHASAFCKTYFFCRFSRMNFLSNILREEGGFDYKKAIVDSIVILIRDIPDAKESGLLHLCEFIEDCEFTYLSTQVVHLSICGINPVLCNFSLFKLVCIVCCAD